MKNLTKSLSLISALSLAGVFGIAQADPAAVPGTTTTYDSGSSTSGEVRQNTPGTDNPGSAGTTAQEPRDATGDKLTDDKLHQNMPHATGEPQPGERHSNTPGTDNPGSAGVTAQEPLDATGDKKSLPADKSDPYAR